MTATDRDLALVDPRALSATRVALHHAALIVSSVGRMFAEKQPGFRHASLTWEDPRMLIGATLAVAGSVPGSGPRAALDFARSAIDLGNVSSVELNGRSADDVLGAVRAWLTDLELDGPRLAVRRPGDLPPGPIGSGDVFELETSAAHAIARWFSFANRQLAVVAAPAGVALPLPCWPDHFDLAAMVPLAGRPVDEAEVTLGFSPGDASIDEPYFYITPWPLSPTRVADVPAPAGGRWHVEGWVGLELSASALMRSDDPDATAAAFLERGLELGRDLLVAT